MPKKSINRNQAVKKSLALSNEELTNNWSKLASLIRHAEKIEWPKAKKKALDLLKGDSKQVAYDYIDQLRSNPVSKPDKKPTKSKSKEDAIIVRHPATNRRDQFSMNYRRLLKLAPDLEERLLAGEDVVGKSSPTGYMDFNLELIYQDDSGYYLAMSHYFKQGGDMIADPDMVILFNPEMQIIEALSYQDQFGYVEVYDNIYTRKMVRPDEKQAQNSFLARWLINLRNQGHSIKWKHIKSPEPPKGRKARSNSNSNTFQKPDISYMEESALIGIKEFINSMMVDALYKLYNKHVNKEQPMRAIARYYAVDKILHSPMINPKVSFPTDEELRADYQELINFQNKDEQIDKPIVEPDEQNPDNMKEDQKIEQTVKHWRKLAAVIKEVEGDSITPKEAEEKALKLKADGKAEDYVIKAFIKQRKSGLESLQKKVYTILIKSLPKFHEELSQENSHARIVLDKDESYELQKAAAINNSTQQYVIHQENGEGTLLFAVQKVRKKAWVTLSTNNFFNQNNAIDYMQEAYSSSSNEHYEINQQFLRWLGKLSAKTSIIGWGNENKAEETLTIDQFQLFEVGDLVTRHKGNGTNNKVYRVKTLEGFFEQEGEFKVTIEDSIGVVDELIEESSLKLVAHSNDYKGDEWKNKVLGKDNQLEAHPEKSEEAQQAAHTKEKASDSKNDQSDDILQFNIEKLKEDAKTIPDFKPGQVKLVEAHIRANINQGHIDWINKHKQGIIITPIKNPKNNTASLERDLEIQALPPGKRLSRTGKIYYEGRSNRSDLTDKGL